MGKVRVDLRLDEDLVADVDAYARDRHWTRTLVILQALNEFLDDATRGVPDAPPAPVAARPKVESAVGDDLDWQEIEMARRRAKR